MSPDIWSQWLLNRRFSGDPQRKQAALDYLYPVRDKVLSNANLTEGETLLDIGCGDGLIAFGALERVKTGKVIFSDISQHLLYHAQTIAREMGVLDRCQFLLASADDLSALDDVSVDIATTRSVLIYVSAKQQAFKEFYRVLKPKGRLSIFEPINRFAHSTQSPHMFRGYEVTPVMEIAQKVKAVYQRLQPPDTDPMLDFDERDLIAFAERAGFTEIHLELQAEVKPPAEGNWETFLRTAGNPKIPTLEEAIQQALTPDEAEKFVAYLRPLVERKQGASRSAVAYLWAVKN
ncbi:MAG: class I SAM-dependent methyltransferase [Chloroflexaceae bacterium]|nr:class I SAM-dependent methyltransferase [Chloroflexaceae bacterium]